MGTTCAPTWMPSPRSSRNRITPLAASRPKALPPESKIACTCCTVLVGCSRSVSRVPGAEPRTSTPAVAPFSKSRTVQPVGRRASVNCPTLMPCTSVMPPEFSSASARRDSALPAANAATLRLNSRLRITSLYLATLILSAKTACDVGAAHDPSSCARNVEIRRLGRLPELRRHCDARHCVRSTEKRRGILLAPGRFPSHLRVRRRHGPAREAQPAAQGDEHQHLSQCGVAGFYCSSTRPVRRAPDFPGHGKS